eukprot:PhM_4_TR13228/c0_g1_i1/m.25743
MLRRTLNVSYRIIPHINREIEELAHVQKYQRWSVACNDGNIRPERKVDQMVKKLNAREVRRRGIFPERSIARRMSNTYAKDGIVSEPYKKVKWITVTVVGFDGHPFKFRLWPHHNRSLNQLIDGSGMNFGHPSLWSRCLNPDCCDRLHGDGCLVNVDIDTLNRLPAPGRYEYYTLTNLQRLARGDITYNTRFSCQIKLVPELDGAVFALKQYHSAHLRGLASDWSDIDNYAVVALARQQKIMSWTPPLEKPLDAPTPVGWDLLWAEDYEEVLQQKYPWYQRKDGMHTRPKLWSAYV